METLEGREKPGKNSMGVAESGDTIIKWCRRAWKQEKGRGTMVGWETLTNIAYFECPKTEGGLEAGVVDGDGPVLKCFNYEG